MSLESDFKRLTDQWTFETKYTSSSTEIAQHPALQAIIALGKPVLPLIFADWELHGGDQTKHWFAALEALTGKKTEDMVGEESLGNILSMADSWTNWWYQNCSREERTQTGIASNGICYTPNGLPVACWYASGLMTECESGNHPDYKFPAIIEYVGPERDDPHYEYGKDQITIIYSDGYVVLAMYEHCYTLWHLAKGDFLGGFGFNKHWRIVEEDLVKIREAGLFMSEKDTDLKTVVDQMIEDRRVFAALQKAAEVAYHVWNSPSDTYERDGAMLQLGKALREMSELTPVPEGLRHPHVKKKA